jgi:hypothetical protein
MFAKVPTEIFLIIRSYLVVCDYLSEDPDGILKFIREDAERSWRSFLAVSRDHSLIRKETMEWSLNSINIKRYLENEQFRQYLKRKIINPAQKLLLNFTASLRGITNNVMNETIRNSNAGSIYIESNAYLTDLPSSSELQVLSLYHCQSLKQVGDYPNLKSLQILGFPCLRTGRVANLRNFMFGLSGQSIRSTEQLLPQFPLEQIQKLMFGFITDSFFQIAHRLSGLKYLHLCALSGLSFSGELFPLLIELHISGFNSIHLAGMTGLRHLEIINTRSSQIFEKEEIFPQLESFSYDAQKLEEQEDLFNSLLNNVTRLSLKGSCSYYLRSDFILSVNEKVSSLDLSIKGQEVTIPDRFFEMVKLQGCIISESSSFAKVQILDLNNCPSITDIGPFKDIPYLELANLSDVDDFSSLGSQRYLKVDCCQGLSDLAVSRFGNVFHLDISNCRNLTKFIPLNGSNKFLTLNNCFGLRSVELSNQDYIHVKIIDCSGIFNFHIHGSVYSLDFALSEQWTKEMIPSNYQYLNSEEKEVENQS